MAMAGSAVRGYKCAAAFLAAGSASAVPALLIEVTEGGPQQARESVARLADAGLMRLGASAELPGRAAGWMILSRPGSDWVDVITRAPGLGEFFGGTCTMRDGWLEAAARTGYCALIAGSIDAHRIPGADPEAVAEMVAAVGAAGLAAGGLVPLYLSAYRSRPWGKIWPGVVAYGRPGSGENRRKRIPGLAVRLDTTDVVVDSAKAVRAEDCGMDYEWVRQRLSVQFVLRKSPMPPTMVDQMAEDITPTGTGGRVRRAIRARRRSLTTWWLVLRSITAFLLRRPFPHWHIMGIHMVETDKQDELVEVAVDSWAGELLSVEEADEMGVWLRMSSEDAHEGGVDTVVVHCGDYRVGVLRDDDFYREILAEPRHADTLLMTEAVRSRAPDGSWQLHIRTLRRARLAAARLRGAGSSRRSLPRNSGGPDDRAAPSGTR